MTRDKLTWLIQKLLRISVNCLRCNCLKIKFKNLLFVCEQNIIGAIVNKLKFHANIFENLLFLQVYYFVYFELVIYVFVN